VRVERADRSTLGSSRTRDLFLASTVVVVLVAAVDPLVGALALAGSHAVEYFIVVAARSEDRGAVGRGGLAGRLTKAVGPILMVVAWLGFFAAFRWMVDLVGEGPSFAFAIFAGATHFLYDAFIWRSPRPSRIGRWGAAVTTRAMGHVDA
jgi:hypothetical protein